EYQHKIVENAKTLAKALEENGLKLVSGGTDNHLMMLDLRDTGVTGKELEQRLDSVNITANKNMIPNDPASPFVTSGVRLGTPSVTTRGFGTEEMKKIAEFIAKATFDYENSAEEIKAGVAELCEKFPLYE
ncbi:MAG: serine hydroxymethyltransferase, partial [Oscillospiraceae bacterium]|nr:serine hydroxymethyltransferase [Oscillospiraceae bacterium]